MEGASAAHRQTHDWVLLTRSMYGDELFVCRRCRSEALPSFGFLPGEGLRRWSKRGACPVASAEPSLMLEAMIVAAPDSLLSDLAAVLNRHSRENASNTPDFILAGVMVAALTAFEQASNHRENWYGKPCTCTARAEPHPRGEAPCLTIVNDDARSSGG